MLTFGVEQSFQVLKTFFILNPERIGKKRLFGIFHQMGKSVSFSKVRLHLLGLVVHISKMA